MPNILNINISGSNTNIITYGKTVHEEFDIEKGENEVIILIPGNPGFVEFYENFGEILYENTKTPIWIISKLILYYYIAFLHIQFQFSIELFVLFRN